MKLRYYQEEAISALYSYFGAHPNPDQNPVLAMPTGTGKAVVIAGFIQGVLQAWPSQRVMMLTHVKELIEQNARNLKRMWPQAPLGVYSSGLGEKSAYMPITFAGVQSAVRNPEVFEHQDIVLIDECHLVSDNENGSYKKLLSFLRKRNPYLRVVGLSATPFRLGLGMITDGGVFTDVAYDICGLNAFTRLLDEGWLSPLIPMQTETILDVSGVGKRGGEFIANELQDAVARYDITKRALEEAEAAARNRKHWLVYCAGIDHVEMTVEILNSMGIGAAGVHSKMPAANRDNNIEMFKAGVIQALVNADILTTGFDLPGLDCEILLRPTSSPGLHVQILGRGTRPVYADGFDTDTIEGRLAAMQAGPKQNCLVLDFAGNVRRLGPINDPRIPRKKGEGPGDIPVKMCVECGCLNHISARECINCGHEFQFIEKITTSASTAELIKRTTDTMVRDEPQVVTYDVDRITYAEHEKAGMPPSLKVSYYCGLQRYTEWICLWHEGNPIQRKAFKWWEERTDGMGPPSTIEDAMDQVDTLHVPKQIRVWVNKHRYPEILSYVFQEEAK